MSLPDTTNAAVEQKRALVKKLLAQKRELDERRTQVLESLPEYTRHSYEMYLTSDSAELAEVDRFYAWVQQIRADDGYTFELPRLAAQRPHVALERPDGTRHEMLNFSSYNYLGYGYHPEVIQAAKDALDTYGLGACSSPVISGTFGIQKQLEQRLAGWVGGADYAASLFSSGYGANLGTISALVHPGHHIVLDRSAHMSLLEGAQLSRAHISYFRHNDPDHLRSVLSRVESGKVRTLVCTEGVFSADGDMGRVADITEVAHAQGAMVLVDEAHSMLVAGPTGRGVAEAQGVLDQIDFIVITFSKAFGGVGGALVAKQEVIQYVNWYAKCRFFSCALDPAVTGGIDKALELAMGPDGQERRQRLWDNAAYMRSRLRSKVVIGESESWVIPVMYGSERLTTPINRALHQRGLDTSIMQFPAVNKGESRIRLFVTSEHSCDQIDHSVDILTEVAREFAFTR